MVPVIVGGLVGLGVALLIRSGVKGKAVLDNEGSLVLRPSMFFGIMGFVTPVLMGVLLCFLGTLLKSKEVWTILAIAEVVFILLALPPAIVSRQKIVANDLGLTFHHPLKSIVELKWHEIEKIECKTMTKLLVLSGGSKKIKIKMLFKGYSDLIALMKTKIDVEKHSEVLAKLDKAMSRFWT